MRKIILNLAISLDGYICREDGSYDWIVGDSDKSSNTSKQFNFESFIDSVDTIVMGKGAYLDCGVEHVKQYKEKQFYVASSKKLDNHYKNLKFIKGDIGKQILKLKKEKGKDIWLFGGSGLAKTFIKDNLIDEYIIGIIPTILGKGKKLFHENNSELKLHLTESTITEGIIISRYKVRK